jgi:lipopolysaccharide export system protein LptC
MMSDSHDQNSQNQSAQEAEARIERLGRFTAPQGEHNRTYSETYSRVISRLRLVLPIIAFAIIAALLSWPSMDKNALILEPEQRDSLSTVRKNELTNPRFESVDSKNQPYTIIAERAAQDDSNADMIILSAPVADMQLQSGNWIALRAATGFYHQTEQTMDLREDVHLYHDAGYEMTMAQLGIDMRESIAETQSAVRGHGPAGTLDAENGLHLDNKSSILTFHGPAKLVLKESGKALSGLGRAP